MNSAAYLADFIDNLAELLRPQRGHPIGYRDERLVYCENMLWRAAMLEDFDRRTKLTASELSARDWLRQQLHDVVVEAAVISRARHAIANPKRKARGPSDAMLYLNTRPTTLDPFAA